MHPGDAGLADDFIPTSLDRIIIRMSGVHVHISSCDLIPITPA